MYDTRSRKHTAQKTQRGFSLFNFILLVAITLAGGYAFYFFYATNVWHKTGDVFIVNKYIEVVARNLDPIPTEYGNLRYGDSCTIIPDGTVTIVVGIGAQGIHEPYILVTYKNSDAMRPWMCPGQNDLPFFVTKAQLSAMLEAEEQKKREALVEERKRAIVEQFLGDNKKKSG